MPSAKLLGLWGHPCCLNHRSALNTSLFIYLFSLFWGCHRPSRQDAGILQSSGTLPEQRSWGVCHGRGARPSALLSRCCSTRRVPGVQEAGAER